jgi:hypothetical protein
MAYQYVDSTSSIDKTYSFQFDALNTSSLSKSIKSLNPILYESSSSGSVINAAAGNQGGAVLTKSASATENNNAVNRIAQDLLELQKIHRHLNTTNYPTSASFNLNKNHQPAPKPAPSSVDTYSQAAAVTDSAYLSNLERDIMNSSEPLHINEIEEIDFGGLRGFWINKAESQRWTGEMPLNEYQVNEDPNPEIITKQTNQTLEYVQELG